MGTGYLTTFLNRTALLKFKNAPQFSAQVISKRVLCVFTFLTGLNVGQHLVYCSHTSNDIN